VHQASDDSLAFSSGAEFRLALGKRLRRLRIERHLSQKTVALYADVHQSTIQRIESGELEIGLRALLGVQEAFGFDTLEALLGQLPSQRVRARLAEDC
jgi:transcriptional regulator with XRE-family HTH domain